MLVKENVQNISSIIDKLFDFVKTDEAIQNDLLAYINSLPEKVTNQNQLQTALMPYVFERTIESIDKNLIDYFMEKNSDITKEDIEVLNGLKKTIFSVFKIKKILKNGFELYNLVNEKSYSTLTLVKMVHFRGVFPEQYMVGRIFPLNGEFYLIEIDNVLPEKSSEEANKYAVMMQLENPEQLYIDNDEKFAEIQNTINSMTVKFDVFFGKDEIITTTEYVDDLLGHFNDYIDSIENTEQANINDYIATPKTYSYFDVKEITSDSSDIMEAAVMGFSSHKKVYDVGIIFDAAFGMLVLPFYGTFKEIFLTQDYKTIDGFKECILNYFNSPKIPPLPIIKVYKNNPEHFMKIVSEVLELDSKTTIDELMQKYKKDYLKKNKFSSSTVLYSSKAFSFLMEKEVKVDQELTNNNIGRNEPCPCGSGKKYKKCCIS